MSENTFEINSFSEILANDYMEKLFYFCLKKTGNTVEAEELSSDIILNALISFNNGAVPENFNAYIWKIANNRYSFWVAQKNKTKTLIVNEDISLLNIRDYNNAADEVEIIDSLKLLRRELAFTVLEYRKILIEYYIKNKSLKDIAESLNLPIGTIKTKLYRCRKNLKEGMSMAREFGKKSYNPEEVSFVASGNQPSGLPWRAVQRKLPNNILLHASNNPSTIEELSMELGIAMPYMEEEVDMLERATLLKKIGNKYITNFFIADKQCQIDMYNALREDSEKRSRLIDKIADDMLPVLHSLNTVRNDMSDEDVKWFSVLRINDFVISMLNGEDVYFPRLKRENGENWGFTGYEKAELPESCVSGHNGTSRDEKSVFWNYNISDYGLWWRIGKMDSASTFLLGDIIRNKRKISELTFTEKEIWNEINGKFAHCDEEENVIPDILVFEDGALKKFKQKVLEHELFEETKNVYKNAHNKIKKILADNNNKVLHEQLNYYATAQIYDTRMMTVHDEVNSGRLIVPKEPDKSTIAMYLEIK